MDKLSKGEKEHKRKFMRFIAEKHDIVVDYKQYIKKLEEELAFLRYIYGMLR